MDEDYGFCTRCGATHAPGAQFCPQCGKSFVDDDKVVVGNKLSSNPLLFFTILLGLFAGISLAEGVISTFSNDFLVNYIKTLQGDRLQEYLSGLGLDTLEQYADILYKEGVVSLIDGILVLVVFVLCLKRRYWKVAVILCLIASLLVLVSFVFMTPKMMQNELFSNIVRVAIGLLITRGIYINKKLFR